jgi:hypothetical protein
MITYNCEWCGNEHTQLVGNYNRNENHFCSKSCGLNYRWKEHNKIKEQMLKEIIVCFCGCGQKLNKWTLVQESGGIRERNFILGHNGNIPNDGHFKKGQTPWNEDIPMSEESRIKLSCTNQHIDVEDFDGFTSGKRTQEMNKPLYYNWRKNVFEKDNYICQLCGIKSIKGV